MHKLSMAARLLLAPFVLVSANAGCSADEEAHTDAEDDAAATDDGGAEGEGDSGGTGASTGGTDGDDGSGTGEGDDADPQAEPAPSPLGTNLSGINDWTPAVPFVDLMRQARGWSSGDGTVWDDGRTVAVDAQGWPTALLPGQSALARIYTYREGTPLPWTRLIVRYEGTGTLAYQGGVTRNESLSAPGRDVVDVDTAQTPSMFLVITATDPDDPIRDIRVVPDAGVCSDDGLVQCSDDSECADVCEPYEDIHARQVFHPEFLRRIGAYGTLRFMDWMNTNHTRQETWEQRPRLDEYAWTRDGVPVEVMVKLANRLKRDPWFTMPHTADDDYVRQFATVVRDTLDPALTIYIEHSNEVWNGVFPQADDAAQQGLAAGLSDDPHLARLRWHAQRSVQIFAIWEEVFGGTDRLVRVMGSHAASKNASIEVLDHDDASAHTDALAIAPYFGGYLGHAQWEAELERMSVAELFEEIETVAVPEAIAWMRHSAQVARERGVDLIAYEGGQHLVALDDMQKNEAIGALMDEVNRHPRMKDVYLDYLEAWREYGGLFVHFTDCAAMNAWGRWGALEHSAQPRERAPKLDALMTFIETVPQWW